jgi:hypothetical protein
LQVFFEDLDDFSEIKRGSVTQDELKPPKLVKDAEILNEF